ncbi:hypothetical protein ANN_24472 [Periplaneta americana]|uniref:Uncharacterized protein n=1 Tax=Periplaneta americana TaxID=6978 RepID=A0ABQ8S3L4_PERAM|nr:hypothetical protein ANN_24472 [Periplaneta americana]
MAGLCEGGNEPPGSLNASKISFNIAVTDGDDDDDDDDDDNRVSRQLNLALGGRPVVSDLIVGVHGDSQQKFPRKSNLLGGVHNNPFECQVQFLYRPELDEDACNDCNDFEFRLWFEFKVCHGSLYAVMWLADELREFNLPTLPQRYITYEAEKLPSKCGVHSEEVDPCIVGPYHHGMARPQVADRGDGLRIWRVAVNILNKQSWTADKGWSSSLGLGRRANNPSP